MTTHDTPEDDPYVSCTVDHGGTPCPWSKPTDTRAPEARCGQSVNATHGGEGCDEPVGHKGYHHERVGVGSHSWPTTHDTPEAVRFYWRLDLRTTVRISNVPLRFYGFRIRNVAIGVIR
jgi:hypothetical protein